jgi:hypothetical protein
MRNPVGAKELQIFKGSRSKADVFARSDASCCGTTVMPVYDKLDCRVRFDNGLAHLNPTGGNEKFHFQKQRFEVEPKQAQIAHLNAKGVGAQLAVITIPTFAFVTGVSVVVLAEEAGATFRLRTRNGLVIPSTVGIKVDVSGDSCCPTRTQGAFNLATTAWGALPVGVTEQYMFNRNGAGEFSLEADEILVEVVTMPASGAFLGEFDFIVSVNYDVQNRAET